MRYLITVIRNEHDTDDGLLVVSLSGGALCYSTVEEAGVAARELVEGGTVEGAFVQKLVPVALYTSIGSAAMAGPESEPGN